MASVTSTRNTVAIPNEVVGPLDGDGTVDAPVDIGLNVCAPTGSDGQSNLHSQDGLSSSVQRAYATARSLSI
jgi:hypothetical protein